MADKRITELQPLDAANVESTVDVLAVADVSAAETKKVKIADAVAAALASGVPDGSIPGSKIEPDSITSNELAPDSVGASELADNAVDTDAIQDGAVTTDKLADGAVTSDKLADGAVNSDQLAANSVDGTLHIKDRSIPAVKLEQNTLTADEIAPNAIGSSELADGAVDTAALQDDACSTPKYQNASVTNEKLAAGIDGDKLLDGSVTSDKLFGEISSDQLSGVDLSKLPEAAANNVLAGPTTGGAATPVYRQLVSDDLPAGTEAAKGAVSAPVDGGLAIGGAGQLSIANNVSPNERAVVTYNQHGLITAGRDLQSSDLPVPTASDVGAIKPGDGLSVRDDGTLDVIPATDTTIGGIIAGEGLTMDGPNLRVNLAQENTPGAVMPGNGITIDNGIISQSITGVSADTYTKVEVDEMGNVVSGGYLTADDIPNIDWNQIENIEINGGYLLDKSVDRRHLADYAIAFVQEDQPVVDPEIVHSGCLWFQESTASLHMWNRNSWMSVGIGRLSAENLRYVGLFDASNATITAVTQFGIGEGFEIGDAIPDPTDELTGAYFICQVAGNAVNKPSVSGDSFDEGDWLICNGSANGWARIDTAAGGGGGGVINLADLLDVDVRNRQPGALLQYQSNGQWKDTYGIDAGTY